MVFQPITEKQEAVQAQMRTRAGSGWEGLANLLLLTLLQMAAITLLSANMLASAEQALSFALHRKGRFPSVLSLLSLLILALLLLLITCGFHLALFAAPLLIVPALLVLLLSGRKEKATP
jgi:hypothetical protein